MKNRTGICSWSLNNDADQVFLVLKEAGLASLHLDIAAADAFRSRITEQGIAVSCTMVAFPQEDYSTLDRIRQTGGIVPDDCWERNRKIVLAAKRLGETAISRG